MANQGFRWVSSSYFPQQNNVVNSKNRFIFVKKNNENIVRSTSILVNPHFETNTKVFINPNFQKNHQHNFHIHVNPNVIKCRQNVLRTACDNDRTQVKNVPKKDDRKILISTKNKLVKVPEKCDTKSVGTHRTISKYKVINTKNRISKTKQEIVNRKSGNLNLKSRKKYVFVNKFTSTSFLVNKVIFKNSKKRSLVNINGILFQKTPLMLKRTQGSIVKHEKHAISFTPIVKKRKVTSSMNSVKKGQTKLYRRKISVSKLKKSNVPCSFYKKNGRCPGQKNGTCIKIHNPDQITLCLKFLQGRCMKEKCLLSHKVSAEKMPTCKYYLEGLCSRDDCQYLHVKINPRAEICKEFLEGFCKAGKTCTQRHQFLCPDYEKHGECGKTKCKYPHVDKKLEIKRNSGKKLVRKIDVSNEDKTKSRYYEEVGSVEESVLTERPKLGVLPSFIPLKK